MILRSLMPEGPLSRIDRAIALVRAGGSDGLVRALGAGALPALAVLAGYWLERVEGVFDFRLGLAAVLVAAFCLRSILLADVARAHVRALWDAVELPARAGRPASVASAACWVAVALVLWSVPLLSASLLGPIGVAVAVPMLAIRGMNAPGWLARVACTEEGGLTALRGAFVDNARQRGEGFVVELLLWLGTLGLTINLLAAAGTVLLLSRSLFGLEMALVDQFLSWRNTFAMLCAALVAMVLMEPLRAALSAIGYAHARVQGEGLDVRAAIDEAIEHAGRRRQRPRNAAAALVLLGMVVGPAAARAQEPTPDPVGNEAAAPLATDPATTEEALARDAEVRDHAARVLSGDEYREFGDDRGRGLRDLIVRLLDEWFGDEPESPDVANPGGLSLPLPGPTFFIVIGVLLAIAVAVYLLLARERALPRPESTTVAAARAEDPRDRAPAEWLDAASALAAEGKFREALRALYLATLVALDRRQAITFDPTLTNWQYLRQLAGNHMRSDFRELTRIFDHKWYGREETVEVDYQVCRELAERLLARAERGAETA